MRFASFGIFLALFCILSTSFAFAADRLVTVEANDFKVTRGVVESIEASGGRVKIVIPPHFIMADIPDAGEGRILMAPQASQMYGGELEPGDFQRFGPEAAHVIAAWNNVFMGRAAQAGLEEPPSPSHRPLINDALIPPDDLGNMLLMNPPGAKYYDTSELMLGDVALAVVLAESDGSIDPESENWTTTEKNNVTSEIINGLNWYVSKAKWRDLTFYTVFEYDVPTGYEPITRNGPSGDVTWVADCLAYLGQTTSRDYCNNLRTSLGTDWAAVTYIADSSADGNNMFADGLFAYSYLGGPNFIMTYGNDGWGIGNMDAVMAHELGHIFYALDEYQSAGSGCTARSGYLNYENQNSCAPSGCGGCASNVSFCIMRSVGLGSASVCAYTKGQIAWLDSDGDSICDVNDTYPETWLYAYAPDPCLTFTPTYAGSSEVGMLENLNPRSMFNHDITMNRIANVEFRVDGGPWQDAVANDGAFDGRREGYHFTTDPLAGGTHIIETRAIHTFGNFDTTYAADTLTVDPGSGIDPRVAGGPVSVQASPNPFGPRVEISYNIPGRYGTGVSASMKVYDVHGREVASLMGGIRSPGPGKFTWDGELADGRPAPSGIYFVDFVAGGEKVVKKLVVAR
jgi:hypothetical protein